MAREMATGQMSERSSTVYTTIHKIKTTVNVIICEVLSDIGYQGSYVAFRD